MHDPTRTLSELQCQLLTVPVGRGGALPPAIPDADLSTAWPPPPGSYAPAVKCPSGQWPASYAAEEGTWERGSGERPALGLRPLLQQLVRRLPTAAAVERMEALLRLQSGPSPGLPLAWHAQQPLLAAVDGQDRVQIFDYTGQVPLLGQAGGREAPAPLQPVALLQHELQRQPSALAWRPYGGRCLAVGVEQGVCLWHLGRPAAGSRSDGSDWLTWLQAPAPGPITTLVWHPQGLLLAAASPQASAGFHVWDVATGTATPISAGLEAVTLLRWSPCGSYLLAAHPGGAFRIWQTKTWWSQRWAAPHSSGGSGGGSGCGDLAEACWAPDSRSLLLAYASSPQLICLHFTAEQPSLQAQLLPVPLAELGDAGPSSCSCLIQSLAWDAKAQRLAVAVGGSHPAAGCVALFDTRCDPILSARFIGFMRLGPLSQAGHEAASGAGTSASHRRRPVIEPGWEEIQPEEVEEAGGFAGSAAAAPEAGGRQGNGAGVGAGGDGGSRERPQLAFLPVFAQGAVLAARQGNHIAAVPLYFAA